MSHLLDELEAAVNAFHAPQHFVRSRALEARFFRDARTHAPCSLRSRAAAARAAKASAPNASDSNARRRRRTSAARALTAAIRRFWAKAAATFSRTNWTGQRGGCGGRGEKQENRQKGKAWVASLLPNTTETLTRRKRNISPTFRSNVTDNSSIPTPKSQENVT